MIVQNTNPAAVAPDQTLTHRGFAREDLFLVVHEHFMTKTAEFADIVLPATMFLEHKDYYTRGGHVRVLYGPALIERSGETRSNHEVINALALRLGANSYEYTGGFGLSWGRTTFDYALVINKNLMEDNAGSHKLGMTYRFQKMARP